MLIRVLCFSALISWMCVLAADGSVVVKNPGQKATLPCGPGNSKTVTWSHQNNMVVNVMGTGFIRKGQPPRVASFDS